MRAKQVLVDLGLWAAADRGVILCRLAANRQTLLVLVGVVAAATLFAIFDAADRFYDFASRQKGIDLNELPLVLFVLALLLVWLTVRSRQRLKRAYEARFAAQRRAAALQHAAERYQALAENTSDLLSELDAEGRYTFVSPSYRRILGFDPDELCGTFASSIVHPDDRARLALDITAGPLQHPVQWRGRRVQHASGEWRMFDGRAQTYLTADGDLRTVVVSRDVTAERVAQQALLQSESHLRTLIRQLPIVLLAVDAAGNVTNWDGAVSRSHGQTQLGDYVGRSYHEMPTPNGNLVERIERALNGESFTQDIALGSETFEVHHAPMYDETGELTGAILAGVNVTEQRALHEQVALTHRMDAVGQLAAGMAHDFNNMLTVVRANLELAMTATEADAHGIIEQAFLATDSASDLAQKLLAIGRSDQGPREQVALAPLVADVLTLVRPALHASTDVQTDVGADIAVLGNAGQISQALLNLVLNAADAMPDGGRLSINARRAVALPDDAVVPTRHDAYVLLEVVDTGIGMDAETQDRLFDPFFSKKETHGTGLGASIVHGIARQHSGAVTVQSALGGGTTIRLYLPEVEAVDVTQAPSEADAPPARRTALRALVVDDLQPLRTVARLVLEDAGYEVDEAKDGEAALTAISDASYDLVVLDCRMPGISGRDVYDRMETWEQRPSVLFVSGYTDNTLDGLAKDPTWDFLSKPFDAAALLTAADALVMQTAA